MYKRLIIIVLTVSLSTAAVLVLFFLSPDEHPSGAFSRTWNATLVYKGVHDLKQNGFYFAGITDRTPWVVHRSAPLSVQHLRGDSVIHMELKADVPVKVGKTVIEDDGILVSDLKNYRLLLGSLPSQTLDRMVMKGGERFTDVAALSDSSWIIRQVNAKASTNTLLKKDLGSSATESLHHTLEKQVDGIFCTDGMLVSLPSQKLIVYTYYYRNEVLVFDSNLQVAHRFHTIDTMRTANIQLVPFSASRGQQLRTPPPYVNRRIAVTDDALYVHSQVGSSNEKPESSNASAIDVYHLPEGRYEGSFYIPDYRGIAIKDFTVSGNTVYALHGPFVVEYTFGELSP